VNRSHWSEAVIFDFNGTLSDDEPVLFEVFREMFRHHLGWDMGREDYFGPLAGLSDREIVERAVSAHGGGVPVEDLLAERRTRYAAAVAERSPVRHGTLDLVRSLVESGHRLAIVTGAQRPDVRLVLDGIAVGGHFEVIVTEEDVRRGKPDPEGFLLAASSLGVDPGATVVLEDSVAGVRAGLAAGMTVVAVTGTADEQTLAAEGVTVVDELSPALLRRHPFAR
jgi:HAD superfamily hydrolase (TIGR01509 family)